MAILKVNLKFNSIFLGELNQNISKLCLQIIWNIVNKSINQKLLNNFNQIYIYKPSTIKQTQPKFELIEKELTFFEILLNLMTDFSNHHLMLQFPFCHYQ